MKILPPIAALFALVLLGAAAHAQNESQDPAVHGRALAEQFCAPCHAVGKTGKSPHEGAPPFRSFGDKFDLDSFPRRLIGGISSNHPDMPEFRFSPQDARDLRDYLRSIRE
jgi:mono/diheme cytochrome c family protein